MIKRNRELEKLMRGVCLILVLWLAGCAAPTAAAPTTAPHETPALPPVTGGGQRLRVVNQSGLAIDHLVVMFPDQRIDFGSLPAGATSGYVPAPGGVYRYAAYEAEIDGRTYQQPVIDWVGEMPMEGQDFTYILAVDPSKWESEGWVIQLAQVLTDR